MANLFFPQLLSGALVQYPIRKIQMIHTALNVLADGSMITYPDTAASRLMWELSYSGISAVDLTAVQTHFLACAGPLRGFTFIDPTDNMLSASMDLTAAVWLKDPTLSLTAGVSDPEGGSAAFSLTNTGQTEQGIRQVLTVPANYQFCFSAYVTSAQATQITVTRAGTSAAAADAYSVPATWTRITSTGRLNDAGTSLIVDLTIPAGQQIQLYGLQLEAQIAPSRYRPTSSNGGVYPNAHWAVDQLPITAEAPNLFSTAFSIETAT